MLDRFGQAMLIIGGVLLGGGFNGRYQAIGPGYKSEADWLLIAGILVAITGLVVWICFGERGRTVTNNEPPGDNSATSFGQQGGITAGNIGQVVYNPNAQSAEDIETARRKNLLKGLRQEYMFSHDGLSPAFMAGLEPLPVDWVNTRLEQLGESWRVP